MGFFTLELCAGAGGQALGLERAGFAHAAAVEIDADACRTLRTNRPGWFVHEGDVKSFDAKPYAGIDLVAGGFPCPPFSVAGKQLGADDERDLFPAGLRLISETRPKAVMLENVRGILDPAFADYRGKIDKRLRRLGYVAQWKLLNSADYGVSQLRPRVVIVALKSQYADRFAWPKAQPKPVSVGELLFDLMSENGWEGAARWRDQANTIAPTIVGGSKKHGGPDLGPTRARKAWAALGVDGLGVANAAPEPGFRGMPRLTVKMVARLQGFPDDWEITGKKTAAYRQVGNAFPCPVAAAVARNIKKAISPPAVRGRRSTAANSQASWQPALL